MTLTPTDYEKRAIEDYGRLQSDWDDLSIEFDILQRLGNSLIHAIERSGEDSNPLIADAFIAMQKLLDEIAEQQALAKKSATSADGESSDSTLTP